MMTLKTPNRSCTARGGGNLIDHLINYEIASFARIKTHLPDIYEASFYAKCGGSYKRVLLYVK
jgi:hypothetical protein